MAFVEKLVIMVFYKFFLTGMMMFGNWALELAVMIKVRTHNPIPKPSAS
jgi:hypothetical protein